MIDVVLAAEQKWQEYRPKFCALAQSKYISEGTEKWTLLGSKVVPPGGNVLGSFILSDVLKLCKLLCAQWWWWLC